jgi:type VI secretion system protein ImpH
VAGEDGKQTAYLKEQLLSEGHRFSFIQVVRFILFLLSRETAADTDVSSLLKRIRTRPDLSLSFPETDVTSVKLMPGQPSRFSITATFLGIYGTASPLPTFYTEDLLQEQAQDRSVSRDFIDLFNTRLYALYFAVWSHYRLFYKICESRDAEALHRLYCLIGFEGPALRDSLDDSYGLIRFTGLLTQLVRSAEGLQVLLADIIGEEVEIEQGIERTAQIPEDQRLYIGQGGNTLGETTYLGREIADRMGKFRIRIGPLSGESFTKVLPDKPLFQNICSLIRTYMDQPLIWDADIALAREDLAVARLGFDTWSQLGFNTWIYSGSAPEDGSFRFLYSPAQTVPIVHPSLGIIAN